MNDVQKEKKSNQLITILLVVAILASVGILAYVNFIPKQEDPDLPENNDIVEPVDIVFRVTLGSEIYNYSLDDLFKLDSSTGKGSYINRAGKITGPDNYTGRALQSILDALPDIPEAYTIRALAEDGYEINYTTDELEGIVPIYNESGEEIGNGTLTMIIAYKINGELLNTSQDGTLRIAFIDETGSITHSSLWLRKIMAVEIL